MDFEITDEPVDAVTAIVVPVGDLDMAAARRFATHLARTFRAGRRFLAIDLTRVRFMDSSTLRVLLSVQREVTPAGGRVTVISDNPVTRRVFALTGVEHVLGVCATRAEALALLKQAAGSADPA